MIQTISQVHLICELHPFGHRAHSWQVQWLKVRWLCLQFRNLCTWLDLFCNKGVYIKCILIHNKMPSVLFMCRYWQGKLRLSYCLSYSRNWVGWIPGTGGRGKLRNSPVVGEFNNLVSKECSQCTMYHPQRPEMAVWGRRKKWSGPEIVLLKMMLMFIIW